ncbi:MAG: hypothetical protein ABI053_05935 [Lacisediminihabitans sp.]
MSQTRPSAVQLQATLDQKLFRWLWLIKMFLAIPRFVILAVLGIAFVATTVIAGIAILATAAWQGSTHPVGGYSAFNFSWSPWASSC